MWDSIIYTEWYSFSLEISLRLFCQPIYHNMSFHIFVASDYYILLLQKSLDYTFRYIDLNRQVQRNRFPIYVQISIYLGLEKLMVRHKKDEEMVSW